MNKGVNRGRIFECNSVGEEVFGEGWEGGSKIKFFFLKKDSLIEFNCMKEEIVLIVGYLESKYILNGMRRCDCYMYFCVLF